MVESKRTEGRYSVTVSLLGSFFSLLVLLFPLLCLRS